MAHKQITWDLTLLPKQLDALTTEATEILYGGAVGGGKSYLLRQAAMLFASVVPGLNVYLFRRTYGELKQNHWIGAKGIVPTLKEWADQGLCNINMSDMRVDFFHQDEPNSHIYLRHCQHEKDMYSYQGAEISVLLLDEASLFEESVIKFLTARVRHSTPIDYDKVRKKLPWVYDGYFPRIILSSNPGGISGNFLKKRFITPAPAMEVWQTEAKDGGMKRVFISSRLEDNLYLLKEDPFYRDRVAAMGGARAKAFLEGDWDILEGGAFADLWRTDVHVLRPLKIPENAVIYRSMDWGTFHPSCVVYTMQTNGERLEDIDGNEYYFPKNSLIVIQEIYNWDGESENSGNKMTASEVGRQIAELEHNAPWGGRVRMGPADNQIFRLDGDGRTISERIVEGYNGYMQEVGNREKVTMNLFEGANQGAGSRVTGLNIMRDYLRNSIKTQENPEDPQYGLYFTENCRHCLATIPVLPMSESNPEDVETKHVPDHAYDAVRYICAARSVNFEVLHVKGI